MLFRSYRFFQDGFRQIFCQGLSGTWRKDAVRKPHRNAGFSRPPNQLQLVREIAISAFARTLYTPGTRTDTVALSSDGASDSNIYFCKNALYTRDTHRLKTVLRPAKASVTGSLAARKCDSPECARGCLYLAHPMSCR